VAAVDTTDHGAVQVMAAQELLSLVQTNLVTLDIIPIQIWWNILTVSNGAILKLAEPADQYKQLQYMPLKLLAVTHSQHLQVLPVFGHW
jgi:hypothetical protein